MCATEYRPATIGDRPQEGLITDEAIAQARQMIGTVLRPEGPYLQDATADTLRNWCNGIGDLNPLYRDMEYGRTTHYGCQIAHPLFPMAYGWIGRTRWGLPGVHGFGAGNDWEFFRNVRPGDRVSCVERIVGVEEKTSKFSGQMVMQYVEANFVNQRDELIARALGWCARHERRAARDAAKQRDTQRYSYSEAELKGIDAAVMSESEMIRGRETMYWDDLREGEELAPIARGPLSLMDTMGFLVGSGRGHAHGVLLKEAVKHPQHFFRNPEAGGGIEYTGIGHHRDSAAQAVGVPAAYDYGPQRHAWMCTLITNWMGDAAFLKRLRSEWRRFNLLGDTTWCKGRVSRKRVADGYALVDLEIWAENQRHEVTTTGLATVMLPAKDLHHKPVLDGAVLDLGLPTVR